MEGNHAWTANSHDAVGWRVHLNLDVVAKMWNKFTTSVTVSTLFDFRSVLCQEEQQDSTFGQEGSLCPFYLCRISQCNIITTQFTTYLRSQEQMGEVKYLHHESFSKMSPVTNNWTQVRVLMPDARWVSEAYFKSKWPIPLKFTNYRH